MKRIEAEYIVTKIDKILTKTDLRGIWAKRVGLEQV